MGGSSFPNPQSGNSLDASVSRVQDVSRINEGEFLASSLEAIERLDCQVSGGVGANDIRIDTLGKVFDRCSKRVFTRNMSIRCFLDRDRCCQCQ